MTKDLVSIIIPVFNAESTLKRCIESVLNQTYKRTEIILVNDGSVDNSLNICRSYGEKDKRIYVIDKTNSGVSSARNCGIQNANGEYILFCDSDDWVEEDWCESLLKHYQNDNLIMCGYYCHYDNSTIKQISIEHDCFEYEKGDFFELKKIGMYNPWNKLFSKKVIDENKIMYPENLSLGEDAVFVWNYLRNINGKIICINDLLIHYYWPNDTSLSKRITSRHYQETCVFYNFFMTYYFDSIESTERSKQIFYQDCFWQFQKCLIACAHSKTNIKERIKCISNIISSEPYIDSLSNALNRRTIYHFKNPYILFFILTIKR